MSGDESRYRAELSTLEANSSSSPCIKIASNHHASLEDALHYVVMVTVTVFIFSKCAHLSNRPLGSVEGESASTSP